LLVLDPSHAREVRALIEELTCKGSERERRGRPGEKHARSGVLLGLNIGERGKGRDACMQAERMRVTDM
jgi:hypothetical protein